MISHEKKEKDTKDQILKIDERYIIFFKYNK